MIFFNTYKICGDTFFLLYELEGSALADGLYELPSALADGQGKEMIPALAKIIKIINHPYSFS